MRKFYSRFLQIEPKKHLPSGCCSTCLNTIKSIACVRQRFQNTNRNMHENFAAAVRAANRAVSPVPTETEPEEFETVQLEIYEEYESEEDEQADDTAAAITLVEVLPPVAAKKSRLEDHHHSTASADNQR